MTGALDAGGFARLMARFAPFEPEPILAVAVSGGADSLSLTLLAADWARARGGYAIGLTVDHRLRPASSEEARQVGAWLADHGIAHDILDWSGEKPATGLQAAARKARHRLLGAWCARHGVLHLLLAHHRGDQAETVALRREDGSGPDGLAGMAGERATPWGRLIRPLLAIPKSMLTATLQARGQAWIEDPSNRNDTHARVRLRRSIAIAGSEGELAAQALEAGQARRARECRVAEVLARHVSCRPEGYAIVAPALFGLPDDLAAPALARVILAIGDHDYAPRSSALDNLLAHLRDGFARARTLGGCRLLSWRGAWLVAREPARMESPRPFNGLAADWERFRVRLPAAATPEALTLGALGNARPPGSEAVPGAARDGLPAIRDLDGIVAVPHLRWVRPGAEGWFRSAIVWTVPRQGLAGAEFAVA